MGNPMTKEERSVVINKFRRSKNEYEYKISLYIYWLIIYNDRRDKCADNDERAGAGDRHAASVAGDQRGLAVQAREPGGRRGDLPAQNRKDGQVRRLRHRAQPHRRSQIQAHYQNEHLQTLEDLHALDQYIHRVYSLTQNKRTDLQENLL